MRCLQIAVCALLGACSGLASKLPDPTALVPTYKIDILQGNVVTKEQAAALQPGMAREQVKGILGSPLLTSVFHADRWDYVFTFRRQGQAPQQRRLTVLFKGDSLDRIESDDLPSEAEFVASLDSRRSLPKTPPLQASEEQLKKFRSDSAAAQPAPAAAEPSTNYPPLEGPGAVR